MATLANKTIASTYTSLLKLEGDTGSTVAGASGNAVQVKTGDNDATPLYLNTDRVGIGITDPDNLLEIFGTSNQLKISYDASNYTEFDVAANGALTLNSTGDINFTPTNNMLVTSGITTGDAFKVTSSTANAGTIIHAQSTSTATTSSNNNQKGVEITMSGTPASPSGTIIYGLDAGCSGAAVTNVAGYFSATNGTSNNYGIIVANGDVGIGTTAPASETSGTILHIADTGGTNPAVINLTGGTGGTGSVTGRIQFADKDDTDSTLVSIVGSQDGAGTPPGGKLAIGTQANGGALTTRLTILESGKVGIGTDAPAQLLHVEGASGLDGATPVTLRIQSSNNGTWTDEAIPAQIEFGTSDTTGDGSGGAKCAVKCFADSTGGGDLGLSFYTTTNGTTMAEQMRIDHRGYLGIGTITPIHELHVDDRSGGCEIAVDCKDNTAQSHIVWKSDNVEVCRISGNASTTSANAADTMRFDCGVTDDIMVILGDGNVGIGTAAPTADLHVVASDSDVHPGLRVIDTSDNGCDATNVLVDLDYSLDSDVDNATYIKFQDSDGVQGEITMNANLVTYGNTSDYRRKTDLKDIVDATGTINQLKLYDFAWKRKPTDRAMGVIAHEAQLIVPTAVAGKKDAMTKKDTYYKEGDSIPDGKEIGDKSGEKDVIKPQQVDYSKFVPLLLKSIQELSAKVTALENA